MNNIAVRRDRQRHGVGRALLDDLLADGTTGAARRHVLLEVAADNAPAQRLYDVATGSTWSACGAVTTSRATPTRW